MQLSTDGCTAGSHHDAWRWERICTDTKGSALEEPSSRARGAHSLTCTSTAPPIPFSRLT